MLCIYKEQLGGQLSDLSMQKNPRLVKNTLFPYFCGSTPVGKAGWPFQLWEWHTDHTSTVHKMLSCVSWQLVVLSCSPLAFSSSHLLSLWSKSCGMQQPFPQQQQLKPASPMLQQGTALRCWRDVYSRGEQWVGRSSAFWSEVDSNIVWGTACWTADVPSPQCKSCFFSSAVLLVGTYSFPQNSLPFQNILFTLSCGQTLTSWVLARSKPGSIYQRDQGWSTTYGEGCFLYCWETAGLADRRPRGAASSFPKAVASAGLMQVVPETFFMSSPANTGLYLSQSCLIRWCLIMLKWVAVLLCKSCTVGLREEHFSCFTCSVHICRKPSKREEKVTLWSRF